MKKVKISDSAPRKYKINECLLKRSIDHHREAIRKLPKYLGISLNTLHNYRNILFSDSQDIPHEIVVLFEQLFELQPGGLLNKPIRGKTLDELINTELQQSRE
jgi:ACT domain-containing protein